MKVYTLDKLVRGVLTSRNYPLHFYLQFLHYGIQAVRELNFDVMQNVKSVRLPVNSYKAVTIPCDFVDYVRLGNELGQYVMKWGEKNSFNRLNKFDDNGNKVNYPDIDTANGMLPNTWESYYFSLYVNDKGEHLGRIFNNKPTFPNSFEVIRERNEIQLDEGYEGKEIVLDYISDGLTTDASNAIHPYAAAAIEAYIIYKFKQHSRAYGVGERQMAEQDWYNQLRILRARMNNIDTNDIQRSLSRSYSPTIKN